MKKPTKPVTNSQILHWLTDLLARLVDTHGIDHALIAATLVIGTDEVEMLLAGNITPLDPARGRRLAFLANILLRLEVRLFGDSRAIRIALETPLVRLKGRTPADCMAGELADLRAARDSIDHVEAPKVRWWRIGH